MTNNGLSRSCQRTLPTGWRCGLGYCQTFTLPNGRRVDLCPKHYVEATIERDKDKPRVERPNADKLKTSKLNTTDEQKQAAWLRDNDRLARTLALRPTGTTARELVQALMSAQQSVVARLRIGCALGVVRKEQDGTGFAPAKYYLLDVTPK